MARGAFRASYRELANRTLLTPESAWTLSALGRQALTVAGDFLEVGVYRGGSARLLRNILATSSTTRHLHLFDTFEGMPETDAARDLHKSRDFSDTSLKSVSDFVGEEDWIHYHR